MIFRTDSQAQTAEQQKLAQQQERSDLAAIMAMPEGRRFMARLLEDCGLCGLIADKDGAIAKYNLGISLIAKIREAAPKQLQQILTEIYGLNG